MTNETEKCSMCDSPYHEDLGHNKSIFDTTDLENGIHGMESLNETHNTYDCVESMALLQGQLKERQRLKAEVEKVIDEFYSKYAGYQVIVNLKLIEELKKRLWI